MSMTTMWKCEEGRKNAFQELRRKDRKQQESTISGPKTAPSIVRGGVGYRAWRVRIVKRTVGVMKTAASATFAAAAARRLCHRLWKSQNLHSMSILCCQWRRLHKYNFLFLSFVFFFFFAAALLVFSIHLLIIPSALSILFLFPYHSFYSLTLLSVILLLSLPSFLCFIHFFHLFSPP